MAGTRLAELPADQMTDAGLSVVIVDEDMDRCSVLAARHSHALVICGNPTDPEVLGDLDLGPKDVAIGLTGWDEAGDYGWNPDRSRNISVDIRFVLWVLDDVFPAPALLRELGV